MYECFTGRLRQMPKSMKRRWFSRRQIFRLSPPLGRGGLALKTFGCQHVINQAAIAHAYLLDRGIYGWAGGITIHDSFSAKACGGVHLLKPMLSFLFPN